MARLTVAAPLDADHVAAVRRLRTRLGGPRPDDVPHLSLVVLLDDERGVDLRALVAEAAAASEPFTARARGLGIFDDDGGPILYVPVVRSPALHALHQRVHAAVVAAGIGVEGHYEPATWLPHVALWRGAVSGAVLHRAVAATLAGPPLGWTLTIDRLATFGPGGAGPAVPLGHGTLVDEEVTFDPLTGAGEGKRSLRGG